jgi:hypothetical protein
LEFTPALSYFLEQQLGNFSRNVPKGFDSLQADIGLQRQLHVIDTAAQGFKPSFSAS